jgi:Planctomycete cytochrome C
MRFSSTLLLPLAAVVLIGACGTSSGSDAPACVANLSTACDPLYSPPTYPTIFTMTFQPTCATGIGTCHTADAAQGGLSFADEQTSYEQLLGMNGANVRVVPGDPACSLLMERLESTDPSFHMPKGPNSLPAAALCAVAQWIANGATNDP